MTRTRGEPAHFVYMVRCVDGSLYTGYSTDVNRRVALHNAGKGARYTRAHRPVVLCAVWTFANKGDALRTERTIKSLPRAKKVQLIEQAQAEHGSVSIFGFPSGRKRGPLLFANH